MPCYRPLEAFKPLDGGPVTFSERKDSRLIQLPCGRCIGCRIKKQSDWTVRIMAEAATASPNHFATLTYSDDKLPSDYGLHYRHIQLFHHSLRKRLGKFRFFAAGEYGDHTLRPHYHALYFGLDIPDLVRCNSLHAKHALYKSELLDGLWKRGAIRIGALNVQTARYTAAYAVKKITGDAAITHYERISPETGEIHNVEPEFARMSLKPGIGQAWLQKYWQDLYCRGHDAYILDGQKKPIPRYFERQMENIAPLLLDETSFNRYQEAQKHLENNTPARLATRETVAKARQKFNQTKDIGNAL